MEPKKRHHYVSKFYLDGFTCSLEDPYLWVFEKGKHVPFKSSSQNTGFERYYYSFEKPDGTRDTNTIEDMYSQVEASAADVIRKIVNNEPIGGQDKAHLAYFIAFQVTRVPKFRKHIEEVDRHTIKQIAMSMGSDPHAFEAAIRTYEEQTGKPAGVGAEELRKFAKNGEYDIVIKPESSLPIALMLPQTIWRTFAAMKWEILRATDDHHFITSDSPVFYCDPSRVSGEIFNIGLMNRDVEVTLPLTRHIALLAGWNRRESYVQARGADVREINKRSIVGCARFVYSAKNEDWIPIVMDKYCVEQKGFLAFWPPYSFQS